MMYYTLCHKIDIVNKTNNHSSKIQFEISNDCNSDKEPIIYLQWPRWPGIDESKLHSITELKPTWLSSLFNSYSQGYNLLAYLHVLFAGSRASWPRKSQVTECGLGWGCFPVPYHEKQVLGLGNGAELFFHVKLGRNGMDLVIEVEVLEVMFLNFLLASV